MLIAARVVLARGAAFALWRPDLKRPGWIGHHRASGVQFHANQRLHSADEAYESARKREFDVSAGLKFRTGQLRIVDPGIVPERPSFPNLPLAVASAIVIAAAASLAWMTLQFGFSIKREQPARPGLRVAGSGSR